MPDALIELDLSEPHEPPAGPPPVHRYRYAGLALAVVLVLGLAGAAPFRSTLWNDLGTVELPGGAAESSFQMLRGTLYTVERSGADRTTTAWSPDTLRKLWSTTVTVPEPSLGFINQSDPGHLSVAGEHLLLRADQTTAVLDPATGAVRWRSDIPVEPLPGGRLGVLQEQIYRPGTEYDASSGNPGLLYVSPSGVAHTAPPERTVLRGVDLATGRRLWSREEAGSVDPTEPSTVPGAVLVLSPAGLTLLSATTGAVLRERELDRVPGEGGLRADSYGDVLLVHSGPYGEGGTITAYDSGTLETLWRHREEPGPGNSAGCYGVLCEKHGDDMLVIEPRTGVTRWPVRSRFDLAALGAATALESISPAGRPARTVDLTTGATITDLQAWRGILTAAPDLPLTLTRTVQGRGTLFGVLLAGADRVQPLGYSDGVVTECRSDARHVACLVPDGVQVWTYRT